jgi:hypothetical protein
MLPGGITFLEKILLIGLAAVWMGFFVYNATLDPMNAANILLWLGFIAYPLEDGILFIKLSQKKIK